MAEQWGFYFANVDGKPSSLNVDLTLNDTAPDPDRPWLGSLFVRMRATNENGFPTAEEYQAILKLEENIREIIAPAGAILIGQVTGGGIRQIVFYGADEAGLRAALDRVVAQFPEYDILKPWTEFDEYWNYYREFLYPGPENLQSIGNRKVLTDLQGYGDDLTQPRSVSHFAYFRTQNDRAAFVSEMTQYGFTVDLSDTDDEKMPYCAQLDRVDRVDFRSIDSVTLPVFRAAIAHNGEYDGWECPVILREERVTEPAGG